MRMMNVKDKDETNQITVNCWIYTHLIEEEFINNNEILKENLINTLTEFSGIIL